MATLDGRTLGRYQLIAPLGAGAMGEVYRAHDTRLDRDVAIKLLPAARLADEDARGRLRREADVLSRLNHPNIATIFDFDTTDGIDFVVMELVAGETLAAQAARGPLDVQEVLRIGREIANALAEAHERGVIHRDLKPGNVMVTPKGQVKLLDFGLAQRAVTVDAMTDVALTALATDAGIAGTYPYMAPEQLRNGPLGPWTDTWALGAVLYEIATGRRPFGADNLVALIDDVLNHEPPPPSRFNASLPPAFDQLVQKALSKSPAGRFRSAAELGAALDVLRGAGPRRGAAPAGAGPTRRSTRWLAGASIAVLLVAAGVAGAGRWLRRAAPAPPAARLSVLVGGVENRTGDPTYDQMLPELLATSLEQSHAIEVYPQSSLAYVLRRMQRDPSTRIDEAVGREICQREGLSAVVLQSITKLGSSLVLVARAVQPDGRVAAASEQTLADPGQLPARIDEAAKSVRAALGESQSAIAQASRPLADVTSKSLDAVRFFTLGRERLYAGDARGALVFMQKAVDVDPDFAMAQQGLGVAYQNVFDNEHAEEHFREAAARASTLPEVEQEKILGDFNMIRRNYDAACPHFEVLVALRPRDPLALLSLGYCAARRLDFTTAVNATKKAYDMQPTPRATINLALMELLAGDAEKASELLAPIEGRMPTNAQVGFVDGKALFVRGRIADARALYSRMAAAGGDSEIEGHAGLADLARAAGRADEARRELEAERAAAVRRDNSFSATIAAIGLADLAATTGARDQVRAAMAHVPLDSTDVLVLYRTARAWARAGEPTQAAAALARLDAVAPEHSRQFDALKAMVRAEVDLAASNAAAAVKDAEAAVDFQKSGAALDTLGRAYLAADRPADAAKAFDQALQRPGERCDSDDGPACYRVSEMRAWLAAHR